VTELELSDDEPEAVEELEPEEVVSDELALDVVGAAAAVIELLVCLADVLVEPAVAAVAAVTLLRVVVVAASAFVVVVPSALAAFEEITSVITPVAMTAVTTSERFTRESRRSAASRTV
jgi:hypothetical protein